MYAATKQAVMTTASGRGLGNRAATAGTTIERASAIWRVRRGAGRPRSARRRPAPRRTARTSRRRRSPAATARRKTGRAPTRCGCGASAASSSSAYPGPRCRARPSHSAAVGAASTPHELRPSRRSTRRQGWPAARWQPQPTVVSTAIAVVYAGRCHPSGWSGKCRLTSTSSTERHDADHSTVTTPARPLDSPIFRGRIESTLGVVCAAGPSVARTASPGRTVPVERGQRGTRRGLAGTTGPSTEE